VVVDGTFVGLEGIILSPEEAAVRSPQVRISRELRQGRICAVLLTLFEREVPVELEPWQLRRVDAVGGDA
jgi:hypothetical protein